MTFNVKPPVKYDWVINRLDLDKLYYSVSMAESGNCGTAWHKKANNCVSILHNRKLVQYPSIQANKEAFKSLWVRAYENRFPDYRLAKKYTGSENTSYWLMAVNQYYYGI